jgi:hypothetical protein
VLSSLCHLLVLFLRAARWRLHQSFCFVLLEHFYVSDFLTVLVLIFMSFFYICCTDRFTHTHFSPLPHWTNFFLLCFSSLY